MCTVTFHSVNYLHVGVTGQDDAEELQRKMLVYPFSPENHLDLLNETEFFSKFLFILSQENTVYSKLQPSKCFHW